MVRCFFYTLRLFLLALFIGFSFLNVNKVFSSTCFIRGDTNCDFKVDVYDYPNFTNALFGKIPWADVMDVFSDYTYNLNDLIELIQIVSQTYTCGNTETKWGEWCVYTGLDDVPDKIISGFDNVYHPSVFQRGNKLIMFIGGWKIASNQGWHDNVFRLETTDLLGLSNWRVIKNPATGSDSYIDNKAENSSSAVMPTGVTTNRDGNAIVPYQSWHTIQPSFFPYENYPKKADGSSYDCCDSIYYSYDYTGTFPETYVGIHYSYIDSGGYVQKAGYNGFKNPFMDYTNVNQINGYRAYSVSDAHVFYDLKTKKFYMIFGTFRDSPGRILEINLASSNWTDQKFNTIKRDLVFSANNIGNPFLMLGPDNNYYLFYTLFDGAQGEIRVSVSDNIEGPYIGDKVAIKPPANDNKFTGVGTPFVMCNKQQNRWQMFFSYNTDKIIDNQIYSAFLPKPCTYPPY